MAFSKAHKFPDNEYHFALLSQIFAHPARIRILRKIAENGADGVQYHKISQGIPLSKSTISQHFAFLRQMNVIVSKEDGRSTVHYLNKELDYTLYSIIKLLLTCSSPVGTEDINDLHMISKDKSFNPIPV